MKCDLCEEQDVVEGMIHCEECDRDHKIADANAGECERLFPGVEVNLGWGDGSTFCSKVYTKPNVTYIETWMNEDGSIEHRVTK